MLYENSMNHSHDKRKDEEMQDDLDQEEEDNVISCACYVWLSVLLFTILMGLVFHAIPMFTISKHHDLFLRVRNFFIGMTIGEFLGFFVAIATWSCNCLRACMFRTESVLYSYSSESTISGGEKVKTN